MCPKFVWLIGEGMQAVLLCCRAGQDGWVWDRFQTTPPMSTYLLMLVVSPLPHVNITSPSRPDLPIRGEHKHRPSHTRQIRSFSFLQLVFRFPHSESSFSQCRLEGRR